MERFRHDPTITLESGLAVLPSSWTIEEANRLGGYIDRISPDALEALLDPQAALNCWSTAFYMLRRFPEQVLFRDKNLLDFPGIVRDLQTKGTLYYDWLRGNLTPVIDTDLLRRTRTRTVIHTLEHLGRVGRRLDFDLVDQEFGQIPQAYQERTFWLSRLFNGVQITTVECFIEEEYFDPPKETGDILV
jgi:hypothetical protein